MFRFGCRSTILTQPNHHSTETEGPGLAGFHCCWAEPAYQSSCEVSVDSGRWWHLLLCPSKQVKKKKKNFVSHLCTLVLLLNETISSSNQRNKQALWMHAFCLNRKLRLCSADSFSLQKTHFHVFFHAPLQSSIANLVWTYGFWLQPVIHCVLCSFKQTNSTHTPP